MFSCWLVHLDNIQFMLNLCSNLIGNPGLGLSLTLEDFGSEALPPHWLPQDRWENVMAISVLPGALDNLCVRIAESSETWHTWYKSETPERQMIEADDNQTEDTSTARGEAQMCQ